MPVCTGNLARHLSIIQLIWLNIMIRNEWGINKDPLIIQNYTPSTMLLWSPKHQLSILLATSKAAHRGDLPHDAVFTAECSPQPHVFVSSSRSDFLCVDTCHRGQAVGNMISVNNTPNTIQPFMPSHWAIMDKIELDLLATNAAKRRDAIKSARNSCACHCCLWDTP